MANNSMMMGCGVSGPDVAVEPAFPTVANLTLHLDATDLRASLSDDDLVATWSDNSSNSWDFTQSTEGNKPVYKDAPTGFNGWPAIDFVSSDTLTNSSADPIGLFSATAGTLYAVVRLDTVGSDSGSPWTNDTIFDGGAARTGIFAYTGNFEVFNYDGTNDKTNLAMSLGTTYLVVWRHTGGNLGIAINNGSFTEVASGNTQANAGSSIGDNGLDGRIAEIVAASDYNATEFANLKTYFNDKYALY